MVTSFYNHYNHIDSHRHGCGILTNLPALPLQYLSGSPPSQVSGFQCFIVSCLSKSYLFFYSIHLFPRISIFFFFLFTWQIDGKLSRGPFCTRFVALPFAATPINTNIFYNTFSFSDHLRLSTKILVQGQAGRGNTPLQLNTLGPLC